MRHGAKKEQQHNFVVMVTCFLFQHCPLLKKEALGTAWKSLRPVKTKAFEQAIPPESSTNWIIPCHRGGAVKYSFCTFSIFVPYVSIKKPVSII